jgi:hypothetical protein
MDMNFECEVDPLYVVLYCIWHHISYLTVFFIFLHKTQSGRTLPRTLRKRELCAPGFPLCCTYIYAIIFLLQCFFCHTTDNLILCFCRTNMGFNVVIHGKWLPKFTDTRYICWVLYTVSAQCDGILVTMWSSVHVLETASCRNAGKGCVHKTQSVRTLPWTLHKCELCAPGCPFEWWHPYCLHLVMYHDAIIFFTWMMPSLLFTFGYVPWCHKLAYFYVNSWIIYFMMFIESMG